MKLTAAKEKVYFKNWGEMGTKWGVNRTVCRFMRCCM